MFLKKYLALFVLENNAPAFAWMAKGKAPQEDFRSRIKNNETRKATT